MCSVTCCKRIGWPDGKTRDHNLRQTSLWAAGEFRHPLPPTPLSHTTKSQACLLSLAASQPSRYTCCSLPALNRSSDGKGRTFLYKPCTVNAKYLALLNWSGLPDFMYTALILKEWDFKLVAKVPWAGDRLIALHLHHSAAIYPRSESNTNQWRQLSSDCQV
jgi:hypothetical protein